MSNRERKKSSGFGAVATLESRLRLHSSRLRRWALDRGLPLAPRTELVYHPSYLEFPRQSGARHAFDLLRPVRILEQLFAQGVLARREVLEPTPATMNELELIHTPQHLSDLQDSRWLAAGLRLPRQEEATPDTKGGLLRPFLWQVGGTLLAARRALTCGHPVVNLGGGFHHAQRDRVEGFCPINDLALAIAVARNTAGIQRALVVDLDYHQGDGTAQIFSDDEDVFTLSIHGQTWADLPGKDSNLDILLPAGVGDQTYLRTLRRALDDTLGRFRPQLVLYVAGADVMKGDRFGDFTLSEDGVLKRDSMVAETCAELGLPLAVVLGGGYGSFAWTAAYNFMYTLLTNSPPAYEDRPSNISARYRRVHRSLSPTELGFHEAGEISDDELFAPVESPGRSARLLGYYSRQGIELALERYGFFDLLRDRGFDNLLISVDTRVRDRHLMRIHFDQRDPEHLLIEVAAARRSLFLPDGMECQMVRIEWLLMQNPKEDFSLERPPLPGQHYPGLGLFRWFGEIMRLMAIRLECDGLMNNPEHYHNGHLYGKVMRFFRPTDEGMLRALERDLGHMPVPDLTAAVKAGRVVRRETSEVLQWEGRAQVLPVTLRLAGYFESASYQAEVQRALAAQSYELV